MACLALWTKICYLPISEPCQSPRSTRCRTSSLLPIVLGFWSHPPLCCSYPATPNLMYAAYQLLNHIIKPTPPAAEPPPFLSQSSPSTLKSDLRNLCCLPISEPCQSPRSTRCRTSSLLYTVLGFWSPPTIHISITTQYPLPPSTQGPTPFHSKSWLA